MYSSNRLAALGDVFVQETDRSMLDWPDYSARILAPAAGLPGNWAPVVHLDGFRPGELREFAAAIERVASRIEQLYGPDEAGA